MDAFSFSIRASLWCRKCSFSSSAIPFTRISLAPGEKKEVSFQLSKEEMNFVQIPGKPEVICHDYELMLEDGAEKWWSGNVTEM